MTELFQWEPPSWIDPDAWQAFEDSRRRIKKPLTPRGRVRIVKRLELLKRAGHDPNDALDEASDKGWQDVYVPKALEVGAITETAEEYRARMEAERKAERERIAPPPPEVRERIAALAGKLKRVA